MEPSHIDVKNLSFWQRVSVTLDIMIAAKSGLMRLSGLLTFVALWFVALGFLIDQDEVSAIDSYGVAKPYSLLMIFVCIIIGFTMINLAMNHVVHVWVLEKRTLTWLELLKSSWQKLRSVVWVQICGSFMLVAIFIIPFVLVYAGVVAITDDSDLQAQIALPFVLVLYILVFVFNVYISFLVQAVVLDNKYGIQAVYRSYNIAKGNFISIVLQNIGMSVIMIVPNLIGGLLANIFSPIFLYVILIPSYMVVVGTQTLLYIRMSTTQIHADTSPITQQ